MAYIKEYWKNKEQRAKMALEHCERMEQEYQEEITKSADNTIIFGGRVLLPVTKEPIRACEISVEDMGSVDAIGAFKSGRTAVLNFASFKNPGGMFLKGSKAQEECLCHESILYNVLARYEGYYMSNRKDTNRALYKNRALYSPDVLFFIGGKEVYCDVITCAAPNKSAAQTYCGVTNEENLRVLESRIQFVLDIAKDRGVDTLILGAYGCGVFGQDAKEVASIFKMLIPSYNFKRIIFAIPDSKSYNYKKFKEVFE